MGVARSMPVTWQATKGNNYATLVTHTNDGRIGRVSSSIRVRQQTVKMKMIFQKILKPDAVSTKLDEEMIHNKSSNPLIWGSKGQGHEAQKIAGVGHGTLVRAGFC